MFRPMLACSIDPDQLKLASYVKRLHFPFMGTPKYDGIRIERHDGNTLCRSLKKLPNLFARGILETVLPDGFEGEGIVGPCTDPNVYNTTESGLMTIEGFPDFKLYLFDCFGSGLISAIRRYDLLFKYESPRVKPVPMTKIRSVDEMLAYEAAAVSQGFEGVCFRRYDALYKYGRATIAGGELLRIIREGAAEGTIIDFTERMQNNNEKKTNALGYAERATVAANKSPLGELGAFWVKSSKWPQPFKVAPGTLTAGERVNIWANRKAYLGRRIVFKYKPHGEKDVPRQPRFKGWRTAVDS